MRERVEGEGVKGARVQAKERGRGELTPPGGRAGTATSTTTQKQKKQKTRLRPALVVKPPQHLVRAEHEVHRHAQAAEDAGELGGDVAWAGGPRVCGVGGWGGEESERRVCLGMFCEGF